MLLRGRRAVHWLFFAFATDVAFWYASQSLADLFKNKAWVHATAVLTVLLPQFAVYLFQAVAPQVEGAERPKLPRIATAVGIPMYADIFGTLPIAEALVGKGVGLGTVLSFMMAVTALSLPSLILLKKVVKKKLLLVFVGIVSVGILIVGYAFNAFAFLFI